MGVVRVVVRVVMRVVVRVVMRVVMRVVLKVVMRLVMRVVVVRVVVVRVVVVRVMQEMVVLLPRQVVIVVGGVGDKGACKTADFNACMQGVYLSACMYFRVIKCMHACMHACIAVTTDMMGRITI